MEFKTKPFDHQLKEWQDNSLKPFRALFWEQGTGKSKLIIDTAAFLYMQSLIDAVIVVAPNGVHRNWVECEIPDHLPDAVAKNCQAMYYQSSKSDTKWQKAAVKQLTGFRGLSWFSLTFDAFTTTSAKRALIQLFNNRRVLYVIDEGHNIKNIDAKRTISILKSAKFSKYRRLLTGTPVANGPFDVYPEMAFLKETFWEENGFPTYTEFKANFGITRKMWNPYAWNPETRKRDGNNVDVVVGYRNLGQLNRIIAPYMSRVRKEDVLDLPPKLYSKRWVSLSSEQARMYRELREEFMTWLATPEGEQSVEELKNYLEASEEVAAVCPLCGGRGEIVEDGYIYPCKCVSAQNSPEIIPEGQLIAVPMVMVRMLRLQQIICGYIPVNTGEPVQLIPGPNPRLEALMDQLQSNPVKTIVWCRFRKDIDLIMEACAKAEIAAVRYDGAVDDNARSESKFRFNGERVITERGRVLGREPVPEEEQARVIVINPAAGSSGLTLVAAKSAIYYSNSFKLVDRLQSEDRCHRIGQTSRVLYLDLIADDTIDMIIVKALRSKLSVSSQITGDNWREWL